MSVRLYINDALVLSHRDNAAGSRAPCWIAGAYKLIPYETKNGGGSRDDIFKIFLLNEKYFDRIYIPYYSMVLVNNVLVLVS